jgi:PIN domain nuclease of toxin-antitoxin system
VIRLRDHIDLYAGCTILVFGPVRRAIWGRISLLPITGEDAVAAAGLPPHHRDPFDRMLVAQALRLDATIVSRERALDAYGVHRLEA